VTVSRGAGLKGLTDFMRARSTVQVSTGGFPVTGLPVITPVQPLFIVPVLLSIVPELSMVPEFSRMPSLVIVPLLMI